MTNKDKETKPHFTCYADLVKHVMPDVPEHPCFDAYHLLRDCQDKLHHRFEVWLKDYASGAFEWRVLIEKLGKAKDNNNGSTSIPQGRSEFLDRLHGLWVFLKDEEIAAGEPDDLLREIMRVLEHLDEMFEGDYAYEEQCIWDSDELGWAYRRLYKYLLSADHTLWEARNAEEQLERAIKGLSFQTESFLR